MEVSFLFFRFVNMKNGIHICIMHIPPIPILLFVVYLLFKKHFVFCFYTGCYMECYLTVHRLHACPKFGHSALSSDTLP